MYLSPYYATPYYATAYYLRPGEEQQPPTVGGGFIYGPDLEALAEQQRKERIRRQNQTLVILLSGV